jgi:asparagine synthase (glutamine-hydrolysing)
MEEFYLHEGELIAKDAWGCAILALRADVQRAPPVPLAELKDEWLVAFERAILERANAAAKNETKNGMIGVLLSGGVDSTLIAHVLSKNKVRFICYTIGFKDPRTKEPIDVSDAKECAARYGWEHRCQVLDLQELEPVIKETALMLRERADPVSVGIGTVVVAAARLAQQDGVSVLFSGLGAEEIFAGYRRHGKAHLRDGVNGLDEETWRGMLGMYDRDLLRDSRITAALHISVPTPFMDPAVMKLALRMPDDAKLKDGHRKHVLREMAVKYGLAAEYAFRPKRAAQYGSRVQKAISRLAKRNGLSEIPYIEMLASGAQHAHRVLPVGGHQV